MLAWAAGKRRQGALAPGRLPEGLSHEVEVWGESVPAPPQEARAAARWLYREEDEGARLRSKAGAGALPNIDASRAPLSRSVLPTYGTTACTGGVDMELSWPAEFTDVAA
jgi:hypothetical protein